MQDKLDTLIGKDITVIDRSTNRALGGVLFTSEHYMRRGCYMLHLNSGCVWFYFDNVISVDLPSKTIAIKQYN